MDIVELEKIRARMSSQLIRQFGYDPYKSTSYQSNPDDSQFNDPQFNLDKLREIKERQLVINQIKHLKFFEKKTVKEIAQLLSKPIPYIKAIVNAFKKGEIEELKRQQASTLFLNAHSIDQISEIMQESERQIKKWLFEAGHLKEKMLPSIVRRRKSETAGNKKPHAVEIKKQVLDLCQNTDLTYAEIAKMVGIPRTTVNKWCKKLTGKIRTERPTLDQKQQALKMCETGASYKTIAATIKTSTNTIRRWCDPIRKPRALKLLQETNRDYLEVSRIIGIPPMVIRRWEREENAT